MTAPRWLRRMDWPGLALDALVVALVLTQAPNVALPLALMIAARR